MLVRWLKDLFANKNQQSRDRWVAQQLSALPPNSRLLDAGAGQQRYRQYCGHTVYVSQDFGAYDGAGDGTGLQTGSWDTSANHIVSDITNIPEPKHSFDAIVCTEVLEHLDDPVAALREFRRLLKPGGTLIMTAPFASLTHFAPYHFYSGFNRYFYETWLPRLGFQISEITPNGNFFDVLKQEILRLRSVAPSYCKRPTALLLGQKLLVYLLSLSLTYYSRRDTGSHELLCFGYHIKATTRSADQTT